MFEEDILWVEREDVGSGEGADIYAGGGGGEVITDGEVQLWFEQAQ
jgi:hypothetical protein